MTEPPFDPNTAPRAGNSAQDRAAMRADMNKVALKLREAGIQLYGFYKIHDLVPYWNPLGFDFMCDNWRQLLAFELMLHREIAQLEVAFSELQREVGVQLIRENLGVDVNETEPASEDEVQS